MLCSQCGEIPSTMVKIDTTQGWCVRCLDEAAETTQAAQLDSIKALADQWNDTPDYTPSTYDQGRVDQRHDMTQQLLDALDPPVHPIRAKHQN